MARKFVSLYIIALLFVISQCYAISTPKTKTSSIDIIRRRYINQRARREKMVQEEGSLIINKLCDSYKIDDDKCPKFDKSYKSDNCSIIYLCNELQMSYNECLKSNITTCEFRKWFMDDACTRKESTPIEYYYNCPNRTMEYKFGSFDIWFICLKISNGTSEYYKIYQEALKTIDENVVMLYQYKYRFNNKIIQTIQNDTTIEYEKSFSDIMIKLEESSKIADKFIYDLRRHLSRNLELMKCITDFIQISISPITRF